MNVYIGKSMSRSTIRSPSEYRGRIFEDGTKEGELDVLSPEGYAVDLLQVFYFIPRVHRANGPIRIPPAVSDRHRVRWVDIRCSTVRIILHTRFVVRTFFAALLSQLRRSSDRRALP